MRDPRAVWFSFTKEELTAAFRLIEPEGAEAGAGEMVARATDLRYCGFYVSLKLLALLYLVGGEATAKVEMILRELPPSYGREVLRIADVLRSDPQSWPTVTERATDL